MTLELLTGGAYLGHSVLWRITMHGLKQPSVTPAVSEWAIGLLLLLLPSCTEREDECHKLAFASSLLWRKFTAAATLHSQSPTDPGSGKQSLRKLE